MREFHPRTLAIIAVCFLSACATTPDPPRRPCADRETLCLLNEPKLETKTRAVRCTADTQLLSVKYVVRLDETDCRVHVRSLDILSGRTTESVFNVPFCAERIDAFLAKQATEGTVPCPLADGTDWIEEVADAEGVRQRTVRPDDKANIGLACLELFQLSRTTMHLETNDGMFEQCH